MVIYCLYRRRDNPSIAILNEAVNMVGAILCFLLSFVLGVNEKQHIYVLCYVIVFVILFSVM